MEKIINRLVDEAVVNVDKYVNNGSTWLIFTESKQWVIELTKDGTLWYNYNFFKNLFAYMSMDVVENQQYITKWVEDNIINGVKINYTDLLQKNLFLQDTLQNGVKHVNARDNNPIWVEEPLKNGVKHTDWSECYRPVAVDDTTHNGVKSIWLVSEMPFCVIENIIKEGVKETKGINGVHGMNVVIQNGVKETKGLGPSEVTEKEINSTIQKGIKRTCRFGLGNEEEIEDAIQNGVKEIKLGAPDNRDYFIEDTIQNGIKETKTPIDGCLTSTMEWMDENETNSVPKLIDYVVKYGVKQTKAMDEWVNAESIVDKTMKDGVKSTKPGGYLGSIEMKGKIVHQLESPKQNNEVEDVIQHGVIETFNETHHRRREVIRTIRDGIKQTCAQIPSIDAVVERVVEEGIKETHDDVYHHTERVEGVIRNGIKEVKGLPDMSGELRGYGDYYRRQKDMAKPHILYVKDVIENGDKDTFKKSTY